MVSLYEVDIVVFQHLTGIRAANARIIIVTGFEHLARILLCAAYRQVGSVPSVSRHGYCHYVVLYSGLPWSRA